MSRTIYIRCEDGSEKRVSGVPDDARITFAKANPSKTGFMGEPYALRIYAKASGANQIACIMNVAEFWDENLEVQKRAKQMTAKRERTESPNGIAETHEASTSYEWQNAKGF